MAPFTASAAGSSAMRSERSARGPVEAHVLLGVHIAEFRSRAELEDDGVLELVADDLLGKCLERSLRKTLHVVAPDRRDPARRPHAASGFERVPRRGDGVETGESPHELVVQRHVLTSASIVMLWPRKQEAAVAVVEGGIEDF